MGYMLVKGGRKPGKRYARKPVVEGVSTDSKLNRKARFFSKHFEEEKRRDWSRHNQVETHYWRKP